MRRVKQPSLDVPDTDTKQGYAVDQLKKLLPLDEFGVSIKLSSSKGQTKWMHLDSDTLQAILSLYRLSPY